MAISIRMGALRDRRWLALGLTVLAVGLGGTLLARWNAAGTDTPAPATRIDPKLDPAGHVRAARTAEIRTRFDQAVAMLNAKEYEHAATALHRVLELAPEMPEAHVNMGFVMLGLKRPDAARDFFNGATALNPMQANAYYGLALAYEARGEVELAVGAMRSYLHLARSGEQETHLARARAALWEWETKLQAVRAGAAASAPPAAPIPHRR